MKFGIIGCRHGHIEKIIEEMLQLGHSFVGLCERDSKHAQAYSNKYNVPIMSEEELFTLSPVMVGTSAINNEKIDIIERCSSRGIHVMADKPIVVNMSDYNRLEKVVLKGNIQVGLMVTERFEPPIYTLRNIIQQGVLGELVSFTSLRPHKLLKNRRPDWHFVEEQCGSLAIDYLIHDFDLFRWFTNSEVKECSGYLTKTGNPEHPDFYDSICMTAITESHVTGILESDWWLPIPPETMGDVRMICVCTEGRAVIRTADESMGKGDWYIAMSTEKEKLIIPEEEALPHTLTADFLMRIEGNQNVIISSEDVLKSTYISLIANQRAVRIDRT